MCVKYKNYQEFDPKQGGGMEAAEAALTAGSAVEFVRRGAAWFPIHWIGLGYSHFAIVLGFNGWRKQWYVIHFARAYCPMKGKTIEITVDPFRNVAKDSLIRVYNCNCDAAKRAENLREACRWLNRPITYDLKDCQCEHWTRLVLTGEAISTQSLRRPWAVALGSFFLDKSEGSLSANAESCRPGTSRIIRVPTPVGSVLTLIQSFEPMKWQVSEAAVGSGALVANEADKRKLWPKFNENGTPLENRFEVCVIPGRENSAHKWGYEFAFDQGDFSKGKVLEIVGRKFQTGDIRCLTLIAENDDIPLLLESHCSSSEHTNLILKSRINGEWQIEESSKAIVWRKIAICNADSGFEIYFDGNEGAVATFAHRGTNVSIGKCIVGLCMLEHDIFTMRSF